MKAEQIIRQLIAVLPKYTDEFTQQASVTSLAYAGGIVTATTATPHLLATGDYATITGATEANTISSLTRIDDVATAITASPHDLTLGYATGAEITGADQAEYNGVVTPTAVQDRNTFSFDASGSPTTPATGTIELQENKYQGYNGIKQVTVNSPTEFTYTADRVLATPAQGVINAHTGYRITGAATIDRAAESYTKQGLSDLWAYVVLGDVITSKDRHQENDSSNAIVRGGDWHLRHIISFTILVFANATNDMLGRATRDNMVDIGNAINKSLLNVFIPSTTAEQEHTAITTLGNGGRSYDGGAIYVHGFDFESTIEIIVEDTVDREDTVAFRDIEIDYLDNLEAIGQNTKIELDQ